MNTVYIGLDGGGTNTRLIAQEENKIIFENVSGPSNICSNNVATVKENLKQIFKGCPKNVKAICIGSAGVITEKHKKALRDIIFEITGCNDILVTNDSEIALVADLDTEQGISVTAGTGSICFGMNKFGRYEKSGGWGHILGDKGSAYDIAILGLNSAFRQYDCGKESVLLDYFLQNTNTTSPENLVEKIYGEFGKKEIANLAICVSQAANNGDITANSILINCGKELADLSKIVINKLQMQNERFTVICNGSVLLNNKMVRNSFEAELDEFNCKIINTSKLPVIGAVKLAQRLNN